MKKKHRPLTGTRILGPLCILILLLAVVGCGGGGGGGGGGVEADDSESDNTGNPPTTSGGELLFSVDEESDLLYYGSDADGITYWFYCIKDDLGAPVYIDRLIISSPGSDGMPSEALMVEFDTYQRPSRLVLPEAQGEIAIEYLSDSDAAVTLTGPDGDDDTFTITHPYSDLPSETAARGLSEKCDQWAGFPSNEKQMWVGEVDICETGPRLKLVIESTNPTTQRKEFRIPPSDEFDEDTISYFFSVPLTDDFEKWEDYCQCMYWSSYVSGFAVSAGGRLVSLFNSVKGYFDNMGKDIAENTITNSANNQVANAVNGWFGTGTHAFLNEVKTAIETGTPPCSRARFNQVQAKIGQPITIHCGYKGDTQSKTFHPATASYMQELPKFDFSNTCQDDADACQDNDEDGFFSTADCGTPVDCNDNSSDIHPDADEIPGDGMDQNCDNDLDVHYRLTSGGTLTGQKNGRALGSDVNESVTIDETASDAHFTWAILRDDGSFTVSASQVVYHYSGSVSCAGKTWWHGTYPTGGTSGSLNIERGECVVGPDADSEQFKWHGGSGAFTEDDLTFNASFEIDAYGLCQFQYDIRIDRSE